MLYTGEYIEMHEGTTTTGRLIARYTSSHKPSRVIEVAGNEIFIVFNSSTARYASLAFNFTFQPKGTFLMCLH